MKKRSPLSPPPELNRTVCFGTNKRPYRDEKERRRRCLRRFFIRLLFDVADVGVLAGIEDQVANRSNQLVDTKGNNAQEEVGKRSGSPTLGFEGGMVDNQTTDKAQEEGKQKTNDIVVVFHLNVLLFFLFLGHYYFTKFYPFMFTIISNCDIVRHCF